MVLFSISQLIPGSAGYGFVSSIMSITSNSAYVLKPLNSIGTLVNIPIGRTID